MSSESVSEPEYTQDDTDLLIAWQMHLSGLGPHGFPMDEATSPLADPNNPKAEYRYRADPIPTTDYVSKEQQDAAEAYREQVKAETGQDANMHGLFFPVERIDLTVGGGR